MNDHPLAVPELALPIIMVVDDDVPTLEILAQFMRVLAPNATLLLATNGDDALAELAPKPADLVITDYMLSGMDGLQLTAAIKARWPSTYVLILSGMSALTMEQRALAAGADAFLSKPPPLTQLKHILRTALGS